MVIPTHQPPQTTVQMEWGLPAAERLVSVWDVAVVVDVLSFTTTVSVALDRGVEVLPYRWADDTAAAFAAEHDAVLAVGRSAARAGQVSLSPQSMRVAGPELTRVVLPSPNGATIAYRLRADVDCVLGACLRNADAVASWLMAQHGRDGVRVLVVAAGERWPDGQLRPAVEDLWGAGAVVAGLRRRGWASLSVEATVAADAYESIRGDLQRALHECVSGRELAVMGFAGDVDVAAEADASVVVPRLVGAVFENVCLS